MAKGLLLFFIITNFIKVYAQEGCPSGFESGTNLIRNSNFNQGFDQFTTNYQKTKSHEWFAGSIYVIDNPTLVHNNYKLCLDSNFKNLGPMLVVDGAQDRNKVVWQQRVNVEPNTDYYFSLFFATLLKANPAQLEISINGSKLSKPFDYHYQHCKGSTYFSFWQSNTSIHADIQIKSTSTDVMGNDFVIDNLKFFSCKRKKMEEVIVPTPKIIDSIMVHYQIFNKDRKPIKSNIIINNIQGSYKVELTSDSLGKASIKLKAENYSLTIKAKDYFNFQDTIRGLGTGLDSVFNKSVVLSAIDSGAVFTLKNLTFEKSSAELTEESKEELSNIVDLLNENPAVSLEVHGHTDNQGDAVKNYELSVERVKNVITYLESKGILSSRLAGVGFGGTKPLVGYGTDEERKPNRRVEFIIVRRK